MLDAIKRWISRGPRSPEWTAVCEWAEKQGYEFKRTRDGGGFAIDGAFEGKPWRLEWGPPQRAYIATAELRMRMELKLSSELQMLLISRSLMERLERETFERYTESNQTQIDVATPEEMRWLAMYPKVDPEMSKQAKAQICCIALNPQKILYWIDADFAQQLGQASKTMLRDQPPFVMMTLRGRMYLRMQLDEPDPVTIGQAVSLLEAGVRSVLQITSRQAADEQDDEFSKAEAEAAARVFHEPAQPSDWIIDADLEPPEKRKRR